jgi:hypothetical protein
VPHSGRAILTAMCALIGIGLAVTVLFAILITKMDAMNKKMDAALEAKENTGNLKAIAQFVSGGQK